MKKELLRRKDTKNVYRPTTDMAKEARKMLTVSASKQDRKIANWHAFRLDGTNNIQDGQSKQQEMNSWWENV